MSYRKKILVTGAGGFIGHHLISPKREGARGRNSDNERLKLKQALGWEHSIPLEVGLEVTCKWIDSELAGRFAGQFSCSQD